MGKEKKEITEEKEEKTSKGKEKKGLKTTSFQTTLIVILLICTAALGGWVVGASKVATEVNKNKSNVTQKDNTETTQDNTETTQDEIKPLDITKNLNNNGKEYDDPTELSNKLDYIGISLSKVDSKTAKLSYDDPDKFCVFYRNNCDTFKTRGSENITFDKELDQVYIGGQGQDSTGTILFYLMKDGTVQYFRTTNRSAGLSYNDIPNKNEGTIVGANGIVKLYSATVVNRPVGSYSTTIGATKDGSFYDLGYMIEK